ncbi:MAG: hypothetical protein ACXWP4_28055 [Polyangiales bacterium]
MRRIFAFLGGLLLLLGLAGATIVGLAASPSDQPLALVALFVVVAVLPGGAMLAWALRSLDLHPLVAALEREPQQLRSVRKAYQTTVEGDFATIAQVELVDGRRYDFAVSPDVFS